jgi:hypothetical protein
MEYFCGRAPVDTRPEKNIVKWLLQNPDFVHVGTATNSERRTAFHSALKAHIPALEMRFCSENYGGNLGHTFVANGALQTMLMDDETARRLINVPDAKGRSPLAFAMALGATRIEKGRSPLAFAMALGATRIDDLSFICARDGKISGLSDTSLAYFFSDYERAMLRMLDNRFLRLHGVFGVTESCVTSEKAETSTPPSSTLKILTCYPSKRFLKEQCQGLEAFRRLCTCSQDGFHYGPVIEKILSENVGNLEDETKAEILATCVGMDSRWYFDPRKVRSKEVGAVLRKFYVRHSRPALKALESSLAELHREVSDILLLPIRSKLLQKFSINPGIFHLILSFAGRRKDVTDQIQTLTATASILNNDVAGFFLGGIESSLKRKYGISPDIWKRVLEYAGLRRQLFSIDLWPESCESRKRKLGD